MALLPGAALYRAVTNVRNSLYDAHLLKITKPSLPAISVGNVTVGGTGKTPIAQWIAAELAARGKRPAILLRGYGGDEGAVHRALLPSAIVIENPDRVAGATQAATLGADALVLDDAFQHRRLARDVDIVIVSADSANIDWPLPAGPSRESIASVRRANLVIITQKAADDAAVERTVQRISAAAPNVPVAVASISPDGLVAWSDRRTMSLREMIGRGVLAISGIGEPGAFEQQLADAGVKVTPMRFADHHRYDAHDAVRLAAQVPSGGVAICTLKDAVKLGPVWPREAPPLWYLSQRVLLVRGDKILAGLLDAALASRQAPAT